MSKRQPRNEPTIPDVAPSTWKDLLVASEEFNRLAPWKWMHDSEVIGLRMPRTREILMASILGRLGKLFAALLYRNEAGRRWIINTILKGGIADAEQTDAFEQDAIKLEFVSKGSLAKADREAMTLAEFSPSVKRSRAWPQFRSMVPGAFPWHVTQSESETLIWALPRISAVARLTREMPQIWESHLEGEIAFLPREFDPAKDQLTPEQIDWQPMLPPPEPPRQEVSLDDATVSKLLLLKKGRGFHLEMDVAYSSVIIIGHVDRPRFPWIAMAVDRNSGYVGGFHLGAPNEKDGAIALSIALQSSLTEFGARPEVILVQSSRVGGMLEKVARQLDIPLKFNPELDALNMARESLERGLRISNPATPNHH